jgi:chromosome segregation protein
VLQFDDPITAVVGPNGCGKSNIVDAIRWCMGEQSAKHLRGKAMDDVIFAGADGRGASGMCEVSLTFENDGRVPIEYLAYSEITVTRKLFRDGTSEYWINKTPCRLRDVTDFFLGTGAGAKAYSIIEQGRVGMIVTSKPEDRRFLIEEAAGITKYKVKKKAAEKKMESTRQNLLRVSDVIAEIEKQLGSLRRQAQKAERYKQYKAELRDIDLWSASQRWLGLFAEARVAGEALAEVARARDARQAELETREAEIEAARLRAAEEERALASLQERLYELDNRIRLGEAEAEHRDKEAQELERQAEAQLAEAGELERRLAEGALEIERLEGERARAAEQAAGEEALLVEAEAAWRAAREELQAVQRELDGAQGEIGHAQADIARAEQQGHSLGKRIDDLALRGARVREEQGRMGARQAELSAEAQALEGALSALKQSELDLHERRASHELRLELLREQVAQGEGEMEVLRGDLHRKKSRHHSLHEICERYEGFDRGTRAIMKQREERWGIRGLVADFVEAESQFEVAVEAALGRHLGSVVVASHEVGVDGIEQLKARREGRASFIPLGARCEGGEARALPEGARRLVDLVRVGEEQAPVARALLGESLVVDDLVQAIDLWRAGERRPLVTLEGEVVEPSGAVSGGSPDAGAGVLHQKRELRELEVEVQALQARHDELAERLGAQKTEKRELEILLDALRKDSHQGEMAILTHQKDLARHGDELQRIAQRCGSLEREAEELSGQRSEAEREAEATRAELAASRERLQGAEERREERGRAAVALYERVEAAQARVTERKVALVQAQEQRTAFGRQLERACAERDERAERRARLLEQRGEGCARAGSLRGQSAEEREVLARLAEESRARAAELSEGRSGYEQRRGELLHNEGELKAERAALDELRERVSGLERKLAEVAMNRAHLEEQLEERYRLRVVDQLHDHHLRPPVTEVEESRSRELRDLIERMGEINLTAIEEYQALEARYTFLTTQRADLESALGQLEEAIAQINRTSKKRFEEVFELVNARFQEVFPRLFRGGRAHLTLTNPGDVLESGIEIFAQPPGKKNVTVELLSGGEKALTAVSLIFAIFLIKPSPFCLLDEVDAPLDEANVGRFNDLVRAMTDRSQFIVITHNKRTMEIADTLYGITMEEPGCSKLVSVNLTGGAGRRQAA